MKRLRRGEDSRHCRVRFLELAAFVVAGLVSFELATRYGTRRSPWREKDWTVWYNAHQLYQREPEELSESELDDVLRWCQCSRLIARCHGTGAGGLTDEECKLIVEMLEKLHPILQPHADLPPIYGECCRRLQASSDSS